MDTAISVGATAPKEHVENVAAAIERIFRAGFEAHADEKTVRAAFEALAQTVKVEHVTIHNCTIRGDNTVQVDMDEPEVSRPAEPKVSRPSQFGYDPQ